MQRWFIWWAERPGMPNGGQWVPMRWLADEQLWSYENDIERGTPGVTGLYRWLWTGSEWQYDDRKAISLYVHAADQRYAAFWP